MAASDVHITVLEVLVGSTEGYRQWLVIRPELAYDV